MPYGEGGWKTRNYEGTNCSKAPKKAVLRAKQDRFYFGWREPSDEISNRNTQSVQG